MNYPEVIRSSPTLLRPLPRTSARQFYASVKDRPVNGMLMMGIFMILMAVAVAALWLRPALTYETEEDLILRACAARGIQVDLP